MQYNYLIDPQTRMGMKHIQWRNSVLIFDEAHNVEVTSPQPSCAWRPRKSAVAGGINEVSKRTCLPRIMASPPLACRISREGITAARQAAHPLRWLLCRESAQKRHPLTCQHPCSRAASKRWTRQTGRQCCAWSRSPPRWVPHPQVRAHRENAAVRSKPLAPSGVGLMQYCALGMQARART